MPGVPPIPEGFHSVTPYLIIRGAAAAIDFYGRAFGATERYRMPMPDGRIGHAEVQIGTSILMLADEAPDQGFKSPQTLGGSPVGLTLYVPDVDAAYRQAIAAGGTSHQEPADQFYGDRTARVLDPFGYEWYLMTHIEDVSHEEMQRRMAAMDEGHPA